MSGASIDSNLPAIPGWRGVFVLALAAVLPRRKPHRVAVDLARLRELEAELQQARAVAETALESGGRLLAAINRDVRAPMNGVLAMLDAAMRETHDPAVHDQIENARTSAACLLGRLGDLADHSAIESGLMSIERVSFNPRQEIDTALAPFESIARDKRLQFERQIDQGLPQWIVGDPARFRQILASLAANAFRVTAQGGVTIAAHYSSVASGAGRVRIAVRDTGPGMDEKTRARLYARRTDGAAGDAGLALCRELVAVMSGEIGADSQPGKGSTFWFDLPAENGVEPDWLKAQRKAAESATRPLRILVAEDHPVHQKIVRALLASTGHQLDFVADGVHAISAVETGVFDLVLMDVHMPVMDGLAAARQIRTLPGDISRIPIIALTASAAPADRQAWLEAGMDDGLAKPVDLQELLAAIARASPAPPIDGVFVGGAGLAEVLAGLDDVLTHAPQKAA